MDKLATARKALAAAEMRAGLRVVRAQEVQAQEVQAGGTLSGEVASDAFSVPSHLVAALPHGLIRRGVVSVEGSPFLLTFLAALLSGQEAWIAFLGAPDVGWACAERLGLDMGRVVAVPRIEAQGARVVSAAIDGFDAVVLGDVSLDARERRVLHRRAMSKGALLLAMNWPQASVGMRCRLVGVRGLEEGHISGVDYEIATRWGSASVRYERDGWEPARYEGGLRAVGGRAS
ncbi:hypothetical protein [Trueperella bernardiae]|uniref:hypothetical protein n=1 Tax=Trueperella bernardiae TaxID=59561 RepID=UPI000838EEB9|nr:hypothetical protein [Trueperella bernardiae]MCM3906671.1 hypothetical protein [Trueperella bernardiae]